MVPFEFKKWICILLCGCLCYKASAQVTIKGEVKDGTSGDALIGAYIIIKGTSEGVVADFDGTFEIKINQALPVTLVFSYTGFKTLEKTITNGTEYQKIILEEDILTVATVEVTGQRISEKQKAAPLTVESLDILAIKQTTSDNFYDGLGSLKGVDLTSASLGFKVVNTRGFNSTSPVRSLQIIDGVDNQSPGLNFSLGNFLGAPELDVLKVDMVVGASSAFYGPNAFNGVIEMTTKSPFYHKGLAAQIKVGERNMLETSVRWGDAIKNKGGKDFFGYKLNLFYLRADDWIADSQRPVLGSDVPASNPGRFDAINTYGDEYQRGNDYSTADPWSFPGLGTLYRTGYKEKDLVDYDTRNTKASAAFHFRLNPVKENKSAELILASNFGSGTTVYQGDNRFSLKNIRFFQNRVELRKQDKFFLRAYSTHENAGDSYDPFFTALKLQQASKTNIRWSRDYLDYWLRNISPQIKELGYPQLQVMVDPVTFEIKTSFDYAGAEQWNINNQSKLTQWHTEAEAVANTKTASENEAFLQPGTAQFEQKFKEITSTKRTDGGTLFTDHSALYHVHGEYMLNPSFIEKWVVGGNARWYTPNSEGTIFYDTAGIKITNFEFGAYTGIEHAFLDKKFRIQATMRVDKNENYDWLGSPAASIVYKPKANNYLRLSFSSAIRNPTLTDQFLNLNVGPAILSGNLTGVKDLVTIESLREYFKYLKRSELVYFDLDPVKPEKVKTMEVGYRTTLFNSLYLDLGYYYNAYRDFIGYQIGAKIGFDPTTNFPSLLRVYRYSSNSKEKIQTHGFSGGFNYYFGKLYAINGNYSWNKLISQVDDPIIPAYNTPEHKFNIGITGRDMTINFAGMRIHNVGFNLNYKWVQGFIFEGSPQFSGDIPSYGLVNLQFNTLFRKINTTLKLGASNLLNNLHIETYGGPPIGRIGYISFLYEFKKA